MDFQGKARTFWGPVDHQTVYGMHIHFPDAWLPTPADAVPLDVAKMPTARTAIGWALASGLHGNAFFLEYESDKNGAFVTVGEWVNDGTQSTIGAQLSFDANGRKLNVVATDPTDRTTAPQDAIDAPTRSAPEVLPAREPAEAEEPAEVAPTPQPNARQDRTNANGKNG
jgi:hypothetical protein